MLKDWKKLRLGEQIHFYGKEFDGVWDELCTVVEIRDDCVIADNDGIKLTLDDWNMELFRRDNKGS